MAIPWLDELEGRLEALQQHYLLHFADQQRLTRDPAMLELLIDRSARVAAEVDAIQPSEGAGARVGHLRAEALTHLQSLHDERNAIATAVAAAGPTGQRAAVLTTRIELVAHRYARHFAGKPRSTRSLGRLAEMIVDLEAIHAELAGLAELAELAELPVLTEPASAFGERDRVSMALAAPAGGGAHVAAALEQAERTLAFLRSEVAEIRSARATGSPEERATMWAQVANGLFGDFNLHVAAAAPLTCRPGLLRRLLAELIELHLAMHALRDAGLVHPSNDANIELVGQQVPVWRSELDEVVAARASVAPAALGAQLDAAADAVLEAFNVYIADHDLTADTATRACDLCDRMDEIEGQMSALERDADTPTESGQRRHRDAAAIRDALVHFTRQFDALTGPS